jgi:hypothetical protein
MEPRANKNGETVRWVTQRLMERGGDPSANVDDAVSSAGRDRNSDIRGRGILIVGCCRDTL